MIQFKDTGGNFWVFIKANVTLIHRTAKDEIGIVYVTVTTTTGDSYLFDIDWNDKDCIRES